MKSRLALAVTLVFALLIGSAVLQNTKPASAIDIPAGRLPGVLFSGYLNYTAFSTGTEAQLRFALAGTDGTALTVGTNDVVVVTDVITYGGTANALTLFDGADNSAAAGEIFYVTKTVTAGSNGAYQFSVPRHCAAGTYPHMTGGTDTATTGIIYGYIIRK